jgi:hypothetical protein
MNIFQAAIAATALGVTSGCAYTAQPVTMGSFDVYSSYGDKLSGKYLLYVDASAFDIDVKPPDLNCAAYDFPLPMSASFKDAAAQTIGNLVDRIEVVDTPVDRAGLVAEGARGMIVIKGEQAEGRLRVNPSLFTVSISTWRHLSLSTDAPGGCLATPFRAAVTPMPMPELSAAAAQPQSPMPLRRPPKTS